MKLPSPVLTGQPVSAKDYNALLAYVRMTTVSGGPGLSVSRSPGGTTLRSNVESSKGGSSASLTHPFQLYATAALVVAIRYGTVNDLAASGSPLTLSGDGVHVVYLKCTISLAGAVTAVVIEEAGSKPADSDGFAYITLGQVTVASSAITLVEQAVTHSLRFGACGRTDNGSAVVTRGTYAFWGV